MSQDDDVVHLQPGMQVNQWRIDKFIAKGRIDAVYKVNDRAGKSYALKTECINEHMCILKMEVFVLLALSKRKCRHFCEIVEKGRFDTFNYIVMNLVGQSLDDLRKANPTQNLSLQCSLSVGLQALEALEELHSIGYLHRDVSPANYAIGRRGVNELRRVYLLGLAFARKYTNDQGVIRKPRTVSSFRGNARYASINYHSQRELCRKDDVEMWLYMQVELTVGRLPWNDSNDRSVVDYKRRVRYLPALAELFPPTCPSEFKDILRLVDSYQYYDSPDYTRIYQLIRQAMHNDGRPEFPYDWEPR